MSVEEAGLAPEPDIVSAHPVARPLHLSALPAGLGWDGPFRRLTGVAALMVVAALAAMLVVLVIGALPVADRMGAGFLVTQAWNPVTDVYGAVAPVAGTLITAAIAMVLAVPAALGIAIFLNELCPHRLRAPLAVAVELLAAIPSIIYGMWGLFVLAPVLAATVYPALIDTLGPLPLLGALFQGPPFGIGVLTAGLILGVMVLPFITSVARQVLAEVPPVLREAAYGVGATTWEVSRRVLIPHARRGLIGGVMLGLGRALGETMAVTFVIGNAHRIHASLLQPGTTISATLANEFTEASGDVYVSALTALGLILFVVTFVVLLGARTLLNRTGRAGR
ncbi:phosphate ABC transporter permease subunit PstC [Tistrella mobilis]|uniref:phosphate ABC transporter permease subunit PstC n=1 Tax=Tistrella mobilis TaxID=171437 RepID=UPI003556986C